MKNITYLFGAGASYNALPIVSQISDRLKKLIDKLDLYSRTQFIGLGPDIEIEGNTHNVLEELRKIIEDLKWLHITSTNHASVDTYAKKLIIKNELAQLHRLKVALSIFFALEQVLNKPDERYDYFYAALYDNSSHYNLPKKIKILSWNYDNQFELSFSEYKNSSKDLDSLRRSLNMTSKFEKVRDVENWQIIQINGYASFSDHSRIDPTNYSELVDQKFAAPFLRQIIFSYIKASNQKKYVSNLSFAWETFQRKTDFDIVENAKKSTINTEVLVVIGYSFPFFNRQIDRDIINNMTSLKKVYFQAPSPDSAEIKERFEAIRTDIPKENLVEINNLGQFHLPNEL